MSKTRWNQEQIKAMLLKQFDSYWGWNLGFPHRVEGNAPGYHHFKFAVGMKKT